MLSNLVFTLSPWSTIMAARIVTSSPFTRQDTFRLNPDDVIPGKNSRMIASFDYEAKVKARAISIVKDGQLEPARGHKDDQDRVVLDSGFTRWDAIKLIRQGFEAVDPSDGETRFFQDAEAKLWIALDHEVKTEEDAFVKSLLENAQRDDVSDVQEALAQEHLRSEFHWTNAQIARRYGYSNSNRVAFLQQLLTLPKEVVDKVHKGDLALHAALALLKIPEEIREDAIAIAVAPGAVTASEIMEAAREKAADPEDEVSETPASRPAKSVKLGRTIKDLKRFCDEVTDETLRAAPSVKLLFSHLKEWIEGTRQDKSLWLVINDIKK